MIKLHDLLMEVGEGSSKPFPYYESSGFGIYDLKNHTKGLRIGIDKKNAKWITYIIDGEAHGEEVKVVFRGYYIKGFNYRKFYLPPDNKELGEKLGFDYRDMSALRGYLELHVEFGLLDAEEGEAGNLVNDKVYMFRLMATIKEILLKEIAKRNPMVISFSPIKRASEDNIDSLGAGRTKLYNLFIKKTFPNAKILEHNGMIYYQLRSI